MLSRQPVLRRGHQSNGPASVLPGRRLLPGWRLLHQCGQDGSSVLLPRRRVLPGWRMLFHAMTT
jgi:hypothetical protein